MSPCRALPLKTQGFFCFVLGFFFPVFHAHTETHQTSRLIRPGHHSSQVYLPLIATHSFVYETCVEAELLNVFLPRVCAVVFFCFVLFCFLTKCPTTENKQHFASVSEI